MPRTPRFILVLCFLASLACVLTVPGGILIGFLAGRWYLVAFEIVVGCGAFFSLLTGLGKMRRAPAMAMLVAGALSAASAILSEPTVIARAMQGTTGGTTLVAGVNIVPFVIMRVLCGGGLVGLAGLTLLLRRPGPSFGMLVRGIVFGLPVAAAGAAMVLPGPRGMLLGLPALIQIILVIVGFFLISALVCASGHFLIRAFEIGINAGAVPAPAEDPAKPARA